MLIIPFSSGLGTNLLLQTFYLRNIKRLLSKYFGISFQPRISFQALENISLLQAVYLPISYDTLSDNLDHLRLTKSVGNIHIVISLL